MKLAHFAKAYMGKTVRCLQTLHRDQTYDSEQGVTVKTWHYINHGDTGPVGWVVGVRNVYDGYNEYFPEEGTYWRQTQGHRVALVALRPELKHIRAPLDQIELCDLDPMVENESGMKKTWARDTDGAARKWMSKEMTEWPRDEKGRWVPAKHCRECRKPYAKGTVHVCPFPFQPAANPPDPSAQ